MTSQPRWSYVGQRCAPDDDRPDARDSAARLDGLKAAGDEQRLRTLAGQGERCAFVALVEVLVEGDRVDDLRALADAGDGRARVTLMELFLNGSREEELRAEVARSGEVHWLLAHLSRHGRSDEALAELDAWLAEHPDQVAAWRGRRLDLLLEAGRVEEVRRLAGDGDRAAARRLRQTEPASPTDGLDRPAAT